MMIRKINGYVMQVRQGQVGQWIGNQINRKVDTDVGKNKIDREGGTEEQVERRIDGQIDGYLPDTEYINWQLNVD